MDKLPKTIAGFNVLPVAYTETITHFMYVKAHMGSKKRKRFPDGRTLFVVNVPPDATEKELVDLFSYAGTVEKVVFDQDYEDQEEVILDEVNETDSEEEGTGMEVEDGAVVSGSGSGEPSMSRKRKRGSKMKEDEPPVVVPLPTAPLRTYRQSGQTAHIVFLDTSSVERAISKAFKRRPWPQSSEPNGLDYVLSLDKALHPPMDIIREHANSYMARYDWEQEKQKQKSTYKKGEAIVDEDGFTLVTKGGAYGQTLGGGVGVMSRQVAEKLKDGGDLEGKKKKKKKEKEGFYAFQVHEKKRQGECFLLLGVEGLELIK